MKTQFRCSHRPRPRLAAVLAILCLAGLLGAISVAAALCECWEAKHAVARPPTAPSAVTTQSPSVIWYIRLGQWRADVRTSIAAVRYLLTPEPESKPGERFRSIGLAMPTNSASVVPEA